MKFDAYFWVRAILLLAIIGDFAAALIGSPVGGYLLLVDGIAMLAAGAVVFTDTRCVGTAFAEDYLKMSPSWYPKGWPSNSNRNLYRWAGFLISAVGLVAATIGIVVAHQPA